MRSRKRLERLADATQRFWRAYRRTGDQQDVSTTRVTHDGRVSGREPIVNARIQDLVGRLIPTVLENKFPSEGVLLLPTLQTNSVAQAGAGANLRPSRFSR